MKFTLLTQAAVAIPFITGALAVPASENSEAKRANCNLEVKYVNNWLESGMDRYRVTLITTPRNDRNLEVYCNDYRAKIGFTYNIQCFWENGVYYIDSSVARGSAGHRSFREGHHASRDGFSHKTGCSTTCSY